MKLILCSNVSAISEDIKKTKFLQKKLFQAHLGLCPRKHQPVVLHAISPISLELCQFKGCTLKLKQANWFLFWLFPWVDRLLSRSFQAFTEEIASKWGKCMQLSMRWYLTYYSEGLHRYCFRLFDSCEYLITLRSNISPCQKATTLILITPYNPSFHL